MKAIKCIECGKIIEAKPKNLVSYNSLCEKCRKPIKVKVIMEKEKPRKTEYIKVVCNE